MKSRARAEVVRVCTIASLIFMLLNQSAQERQAFIEQTTGATVSHIEHVHFAVLMANHNGGTLANHFMRTVFSEVANWQALQEADAQQQRSKYYVKPRDFMW